MTDLEFANTSRSKKNENILSNKEVYKDKLRILCLHGYRQNGYSLKSKLGSFRKQIGKYAELVFITAPHIAKSLEANQEAINEQRSWWSNNEDGSFKGTNKCATAIGFEASLRHVEEAWKLQGPFQGLLGFSQGACFAGLLAALATKNFTCIKPEFVIICAGFISGSLVHKSMYEETIKIPSLHIYGANDDIIPKAMSLDLMAHYEEVEILEHDGGHYFPATAAHKQKYINFFQDRLQDYLETLELKNSKNTITFDDQNEENESDE